jgi:amidase
MTHDRIPRRRARAAAVEQRRLIGRRALSPVDLLQACIARIEALNPASTPSAATDFERAMARRARPRPR